MVHPFNLHDVSNSFRKFFLMISKPGQHLNAFNTNQIHFKYREHAFAIDFWRNNLIAQNQLVANSLSNLIQFAVGNPDNRIEEIENLNQTL